MVYKKLIRDRIDRHTRLGYVHLLHKETDEMVKHNEELSKKRCGSNWAVDCPMRGLLRIWALASWRWARIFPYINWFYNTRRRHSYLGGISQLAFKAKVA